MRGNNRLSFFLLAQLCLGLAYVFVGMAPAFGEPRERIERETLREEIWVYPSGAVSFKEGRVVEENARVVHENVAVASQGTLAKGRKGERVSPADFSQILDDMSKMSPGADTPLLGPSSGLPPNMPFQIPQPGATPFIMPQMSGQPPNFLMGAQPPQED